MKRLITLTILLLMSISAFASMEDCVNAIRQDNWDDGIKYCKPLADENNKDAIGLVARAYTELEDGIQAQKYFQIYADKYGKTENNLVLLGGVYASLGNAYYFGAYGAKKDIKKGLEYIIKGAQLGNSIG
ncbi:hypothetical protein [Francisella sp. SYW-2]|uniref:hypothetical protein n=1 Tax=Francisella sp. SYW-2 TaxID=2610886 RepID=UPI00123DC920|nr:hypothetical protein [Francisella sp. SYW-2]